MKKFLLFFLLFLVDSNLKEEISFHALKNRFVLITLDGVRWQEIFNGIDASKTSNIENSEFLPNINKYVFQQGIAIGKDSNFIASGPNHISLPGYLELTRGHPSFSCQSNDCDNIKKEETIFDIFQTGAVFSSWEKICLTVDMEKIVANCGRNIRSPLWNASKEKDLKDFPEYWDEEYRPDFLTFLAAEKFLIKYNPDLTWISFGDTDEWAHAGNYNEYISSMQEIDKYIGILISILLKDKDSEYTILITADHGRNQFFNHHGSDKESERNWLLMYGKHIPSKGNVVSDQIKSLSDVKRTIESIRFNGRLK